MLYRKIKNKIEEHLKSNNREALLITGARQVGKTFLIRNILKSNKYDYLELNFIENPELLKLIEPAIKRDIKTFLANLSIVAKKTLNDSTIIFFDEIQECKDIITIVKFLIEKTKIRFIFSGSLLGVELNNLRSAPVGFLKVIEMFPLTLEEFYLSMNLNQNILNLLKEKLINKETVSDYIHDKLIDAFYQYLIIGGMPEAIQSFIDTNDYNNVISIHQNIINEYKRDFTKYEKNQKLKLVNTYDLIPSQLNSQNKRYVLNKIDKELKFSRYENDFIWLKDAGVSIPVYNATECKIPLEANKKSNLFKLFLSDVGMLTTMYGYDAITKILSKEKDINCGAIFENFVAQELRAKGFKLYYYINKKHGELDFILEDNGNVLLLEVKSGKNYRKHSALSYFSNLNNTRSVVLSDYNFSIQNKIEYWPIYMIMFLDNNKKIKVKNKINLSDLQ